MTKNSSIVDRLTGANRGEARPNPADTTSGADFQHRSAGARPYLYALAGIALVGAVGFGVSQIPFVANAIAQVTGGAKAATPPSGTTDAFTATAKQLGATSCAATYAGLGQALTNGAQFMVQTKAGDSNPDRHSIQGVVGMNYPASSGLSGPAAGFVFTAPTAQGCEGNMVRVVPFKQSCQSTTALLPKDSQPMQTLVEIPVYALSTGGMAMLMPAGEGCVVISVGLEGI